MVKVKTLALSVGAALAWGTLGSAHAATTTQQVADLKAQVAELQQMVQSLSSQQQQQAVPPSAANDDARKAAVAEAIARVQARKASRQAVNED